jgi:membrane protease YdiL (CAAX protease family)
MQLPGFPALAFLAYLLLVLPWAGFRGWQRFRQRPADAHVRTLPSREAIWRGTLLSQLALLCFSWLVGRSFDYRLFGLPRPGIREAMAGASALALLFALRAILRALRPERDRAGLMVYRIAPRTRREWTLWIACVIAASIAEEAAYRGVGMAILWYSLGSPWPAALLCALAFALAHMGQGRASTVVIFAVALVMHALVAFTSTLVLAMIVHLIFDLVAGIRIAREAKRYDPDPLPS